MNQINYVLVFIFFNSFLFSQDVRMTTEYSTQNQEMSDLLSFEKIDFYKVKFIGKEITQKNYVLVCKEIWDGKVKKVDTIINTSKFQGIPKIKSDTLSLKVFAKRTDEPKLKIWFRFPKFGIQKKYDATNSNDYSLRDIGISELIKFGKTFYAFTYVLPYEKGGMKSWCAVDSSGKDVENWGREFRIKHYLIFEMKFE